MAWKNTKPKSEFI